MKKYLLEVVKLLLQHLHLLQVGAHLLVGERALLLVDPLLQLVGLAEQHELLAALLQHVLALVPQLQQSAVPVHPRRTHRAGDSRRPWQRDTEGEGVQSRPAARGLMLF